MCHFINLDFIVEKELPKEVVFKENMKESISGAPLFFIISQKKVKKLNT